MAQLVRSRLRLKLRNFGQMENNMITFKCDGKTYTSKELIEIIREYERRKSQQDVDHVNTSDSTKENNA